MPIRNRSGRRRLAGFGRREVLAIVFVQAALLALLIAALAGVPLPFLTRAREEARSIRCRNNLNQLAKGMATYFNPHGDGACYPCPLGRGRNPETYNGAEWLASLYWTGVVPDPGAFICPSTTDTNREGLDLGSDVAPPTFGSRTVSYAGMHYGVGQRDWKGGVRYGYFNSYPPNKPMASDDTQGDINHGTAAEGRMHVLFFDSHVEVRTSAELDLERTVGDTAPNALLRELRN